MVIQWREEDITYDQLIEMENILDYDLGIGHEIDGHDMGSGQANIFMITNNPEDLLQQIKEILNESELSIVKIAYREESKDEFTIVWPVGEKIFEI